MLVWCIPLCCSTVTTGLGNTVNIYTALFGSPVDYAQHCQNKYFVTGVTRDKTGRDSKMAKIYQKHVAIVLKSSVRPVTGHENPVGEYTYSSTLSLTSALVIF
jgi:hypothetical protein